MGRVVLLSGGIDSFLAWEYLGRPAALHVDMGLPYSDKERGAVAWLQRSYAPVGWETVTLSSDLLRRLVTPQAPFVPSRNLLLAIIGTWYADEVCIAGIKGDHVVDKSPEAFDLMSGTLRLLGANEHILVFSPFWSMTKSDIVRWYMRQGGNAEALRQCIGCYDPRPGHCGDCPCCLRKWVAMRQAGVEPGYQLSKRIVDEYRAKMLTGDYAAERVRETLEVLPNGD